MTDSDSTPVDLKQRARELLAAGAAAAARELLKECVGRSTDDQLWLLLGNAQMRLGDMVEAEVCCRRAVALNPMSAEARLTYGNVLGAIGRFPEAEAQYRGALRITPDEPRILNNLGALLQRAGRTPEAIQTFEAAVAAAPGYVPALSNLAGAFIDARRNDDALSALDRALALDPGNLDALLNRANVLMQMARSAEARESLERARRIAPDDPRVLYYLGVVAEVSGRYEEVADLYRRALSHAPAMRPVRIGLVRALERMHRLEEAREAFAPLAIHAGADAEVGLCFARLAEGDFDTARAIDVLARHLETGVPARVRADVCFALGDLLDRQGDYDRAFAAYAEGNRLDGHVYDHAATRAGFERLKRLPWRAPDGLRDTLAAAQPRPLFIVGMPRSGTSLTEQIVCGHPRVHGLGEVGLLERMRVSAMQSAANATATPPVWPECMADLAPEVAARLGAALSAALRQQAPDAAWASDKTTRHFLYLGLLAQCAPHARVFGCRRDPLDTCLSNFCYRFNAMSPWTSDLANLGRYWRLHADLMDFWKSHLDLAILDVVYEETVADSASATRVMLDFLGLDADADIVPHNENPRLVRTFSYKQVRQPIYATSVGRWRHYEKHLGPLIGALEERA